MHRVWTALLLLLTAGVVAAVAYVFLQKTPVPNAGKALGDPTSSLAPPTSPPTSGAAGSSSSAKRVVINKIAFLGDDYTLDIGAPDDAIPWTKRVAKALGAKDSRAFGDNGAGYAKTAPDGKTYLDLVAQVVTYKPDVVVVTGGRNDTVDDLTTLDQSAKELFTKLHQGLPHARIFAIKPFWGDSPHPDKLTPVDQAVKNAVKAGNAEFIGLPDPLHSHQSFMADDAHPNAKGYEAIAKAVTTRLRRRLAQ